MSLLLNRINALTLYHVSLLDRILYYSPLVLDHDLAGFDYRRFVNALLLVFVPRLLLVTITSHHNVCIAPCTLNAILAPSSASSNGLMSI